MLTAGVSLDVSPLKKRCVFRSDERVDTHHQVAREFSDHDLKWCRGNVETALHKSTVRQLQVFMLQYGAEVEIRPRPFENFVLVHLALAGFADMEADGQRVHLRPGAVAILSPRRNLQMRWQEGSRHFILKVPRALLCEGGQAELLTQPIQQLTDVQALQWQFLMQSLLHVTNLPACNPSHSAWVDHMEKNVALFLASRAGDVSVPGGQKTVDVVSSSDQIRLDKLEVYMRSRLCAPLALEDLGRAAGVSVRSLNMLCQRHYSESPMVLLRNMRLDAVHAQLMAQTGASVTAVAFEYGFGHLGRFSQYYCQRFGELPRRTAHT